MDGLIAYALAKKYTDEHGGGTPSWNTVTNKPFETLGIGFNVSEGQLNITNTLANIDVTSSMVISEEPLTFQFTEEQNEIIVDDNNVFINFDATAIGVGASIFTKSKSNIEHEYVFVNHISTYSSSTKIAINGTTNVIVYNDQTMQAVYTSLDLANKIWVNNQITQAIGDVIGGEY